MTDSQTHNNLPPQATAFIGREREIGEVLALLRQPQVRLLSLTGPGGTGKSRLSIEVARQVAPGYPDGAYFVALENIADPNLVIPTIAQTLGVRESSGQRLLDAVKGYLVAKQLLLVLDNFEQVIPAATAVSELLKAAPQLKALVSSRIGLGIYGEQKYPVPPLDLPDLEHLPAAEQLEQHTAVALFVKRAKAVKPGFALIAENAAAVAAICVQLDGLPLAIELAAARIKVFSPNAIAARLAGQQGQSALQLLTSGARNLPTRQQTIRNLIEWSYNLLEASDKTLFARLAVFMGGCTIEAAEAICNAEGGLDVVSGLATLLGNSLLISVTSSFVGEDGGDEPRFTMLATVREYAVDQLREREEMDATLARHADYYAQLVAQAEPELNGANQVAWLARLEADYDNIRAALGWLLAHQPDQALRLAGQLWRFWNVRGYLSEGREWLTTALRIEATNKTDLAGALNGAGQLAYSQGDNAAAHAYFERALQLRQELNDKPGIAESLNSMGNISCELGDYPTARIYYEASLAAARELNDQPRIATVLNNLGLMSAESGDYTAAHTFLEQSLQLARKLGTQQEIELTLFNLGWIAYEQNYYGEAKKLVEEGLQIALKLGHKRSTAYAYVTLGLIASAEGDYEKADEQLNESLHLSQEVGDKWGIASALQSIGRVALMQKNYADATLHFKQSLVILRDIGGDTTIAETLIFLGDTAAGEASRATTPGAVMLISKGSVLLIGSGAVLRPSQAALKEAALNACHAILSEEEFAAAWAEGEAMSTDEAINYALVED